MSDRTGCLGKALESEAVYAKNCKQKREQSAKEWRSLRDFKPKRPMGVGSLRLFCGINKFAVLSASSAQEHFSLVLCKLLLVAQSNFEN